MKSIQRFVGLAAFLALLSCSDSGESPEAKAVEKELKEAGQATLDYASMKRDELVSALRVRLRRLDRRLDELRADVSAASSDAYSQSMEELKKQRGALSRKIGELEKSSEDSWQSLKSSVIDLADKFAKSVEETAREVRSGLR